MLGFKGQARAWNGLCRPSMISVPIGSALTVQMICMGSVVSVFGLARLCRLSLHERQHSECFPGHYEKRMDGSSQLFLRWSL